MEYEDLKEYSEGVSVKICSSYIAPTAEFVLSNIHPEQRGVINSFIKDGILSYYDIIKICYLVQEGKPYLCQKEFCEHILLIINDREKELQELHDKGLEEGE